ncbi:MAG: bifunctional precorrin-2 dehydrogenase/sirohydrochlorin ferrochelatase [Desulfobacteraceae bacterium]|nr:bifunctional precorrin-2 dehydrogenase/sirohydrochlorin ferrochelatase [Desulfobacteraceae bacterium]
MDRQPSGRRYYPVFLDLEGRLAVVVGGGRVAERKVLSLLDARAEVRLVSPKVTPGLAKMAREGRITWQERMFSSEALDGAWLVIAATDDPGVQDEVYREAVIKRIFCNSVDEPRICSFIVPGVVRRGDMCLAVSTSGRSPALARRFRQELEGSMTSDLGTYVALLGELRDLVLSMHQDDGTRAELCRAIADKKVQGLFEQGRWDEIKKWAVSTLGQGAGIIVERHRAQMDRS